MVGLILEIVVALLNRRTNKLLLAAESALPPEQFRSYRKQMLNELGKSGFRKDLETELRKQLTERQG